MPNEHICVSEERIDDIDKEVHKQSGWLKTAAGVSSIIAIFVGSYCNKIVTKLETIESLLNGNNVAIAEMRKDIKTHEDRLQDIEKRHLFLDQNGVVKRPR